MASWFFFSRSRLASHARAESIINNIRARTFGGSGGHFLEFNNVFFTRKKSRFRWPLRPASSPAGSIKRTSRTNKTDVNVKNKEKKNRIVIEKIHKIAKKKKKKRVNRI